jgi:RNA polymerase sigma-70 factor (ECF subfamily)
VLGRHVNAFVRRRIANAHDAQDVSQEILLRIHGRLGGLRSASRLMPWVTQVARNAVVDYYRSRRPDAPLPPDVAASLPAAPAANPLPGEVAGWIAAHLDGLPAPYREAVRLSEMEGLSHKAVAERLGLSLAATKSRIRRGRLIVRERLLKCCHFEFDRRGTLIDCTPRSTVHEPQRTCPGFC